MSTRTGTQPGLNITNELQELARQGIALSPPVAEEVLEDIDDFEREPTETDRSVIGTTGAAGPVGAGSADDLRAALSRLDEVAGFKGAVAMLEDGTALAEVGPPELHLAEAGALANEVLVRSHAAARMMGVGDDNIGVEILAADGRIILRCVRTEDDTHVHLAVVMEKNANAGMVKIWMNKVAAEVLEAMASAS